ncbi:hypothetical protein DL96DRAFT_1650905 [Flagelloscypha sp. PMI_526]|nr:hypothetical protein DL96DRAFT_1650905 [Flagelloscypha sp. PMI_526]
MTDLGDSEPQIRLSPVKIKLSSPFETKHDHDNLILRCIDHIDLHTNHILLAYASPTSFAWDRLLRWIDPRHDPILLPTTWTVQLMNPLKLRIAAVWNRCSHIAPKESLAVWTLAIGLKNRSLVVMQPGHVNGIDLPESDDCRRTGFCPRNSISRTEPHIVTRCLQAKLQSMQAPKCSMASNSQTKD